MVSPRRAGAARTWDEVSHLVAGALGGRAVVGAPLGARTTYRVGGPAALLVELDSEADLSAVHEALAKAGEPVPVLVVGKGSNLLVADTGFPGLVLSLGRGFTKVVFEAKSVMAGAAAGMPVVARQSAAAGLVGLEWAVGIPGSVGGALTMNAGGHGSDTRAVLAGYRVFDLARGEARDHDAARLHLSYRHSSLAAGEVVLRGTFALSPGDAERARANVEEIVRWRRQHQPGGSNAGSVFRNPDGDSAGRLIELAGLRAARIGSAQVSEKHANFIQADDGGSADDVRRLMDHVRDVVGARTGIDLAPEVHMVGFEDQPLPMVQVSTSTSPSESAED